jgi:DNA processing protein
MTDDELVALLALLEDRQLTRWPAVAAEVIRRGSAIAVWEQAHPLTLDGVGAPECALERARSQLTRCRAEGVEVLAILDDRYPLALRSIEQPPPVVFVRGRLGVAEVGVSVVGSRTASGRGLRMAEDIADGLVGRGITVISGLAAGIDTAAHRATLAARGHPVGVLGTGIDRVHPASNRCLHERVAAQGALVSQFLPGCPPGKRTLVMRNATMAALSAASVIVEAGERSGSRVHARFAAQFGRPVILTDAVARATR